MAQTISVELNLIDHITKNMEAINRRMDTHFRQMEQGANRSKKAFGEHTVTTQQMGAAYATVAGIAGGLLAKSILDATLAAERFNRTFEFAAGSAAAGAETFGFVRGEAQRLGLDLQRSAGDFAKMSAAANGTTLAGQGARNIFIGVAEAATTLGLSAEESSGALQAIQQMISKGTVQAEELRGQLGERLPGAFQMAARAMGVTTAQLGKMLEQGEVASAEFLPKLAAELHKTYGEAAVRASNQGQAAINRFSTAIFEAKAALGEGALPAITGAIVSMTNALKEVTASGALQNLGSNISMVAAAGRELFIAYAGAKLLAMVGGFDKAAFAASGFGKALSFVKGNWVVLGVGAMAASLDIFIDRWDKAVSKMAGQDIKNNLGNAEAMRKALDGWKAQNEAIKDLTKTKEIFEKPDNVHPVNRSDILALERQIDEAKTKFAEAQIEVQTLGGVGFQVTEQNIDRLIQGIDRNVQTLKDKARQGGETLPGLPSIEKAQAYQMSLSQVFDAVDAGRSKSTAAAILFENTLSEVQAQSAQEQIQRLYEVAEAEKQVAEIRKDLQMQTAGAAAQAFATIMGHNKVAFLAMKAFAVAEIIVNTARSIAAAAALGPVGLPLIPWYKALGALQIAAVAGATVRGFRGVGYTGDGDRDKVAGAVHGREFVFDADSTARYGRGNLEAMRTGRMPMGGNTTHINAPLTVVLQGHTPQETIDRATDTYFQRLHEFKRMQQDVQAYNIPDVA